MELTSFKRFGRPEPNRIKMQVRHGEPHSNLFELFNFFLFEPNIKAKYRKKSVFTECMDKTLSTRRAKIRRLKKQAESKLKRLVVDKIKFDRNSNRISNTNK